MILDQHLEAINFSLLEKKHLTLMALVRKRKKKKGGEKRRFHSRRMCLSRLEKPLALSGGERKIM